MTATQRFIEKAIEGGWVPKDWNYPTIIFDDVSNSGRVFMVSNEHGENGSWWEYAIEVCFLDPEAWKAVGKVEGWDDGPLEEVWLDAMNGMIYALAERKTIEEYLETIV